MERNEIEGLSLDMKNTNQTFSDISTQLQRILYEVRKVPFDRALGKLPGIVRGIAKKSGKIITFTSSGGSTELDKSLLDKVETVLVHCIRNSADHGIEAPEERIASGKSANGKISVDVSARDNRLFVSVIDDGRGVDLAQVGSKAVEKGIRLLDEVEKMSNMELLNLLMVPGFSTTEAVTETSGRGVGMDVLASSIREMGGKLSLSNNPGKGFRIDMTLPIAYTTIIKLGLTLRVGSEIFLVPAENVRESFKVSEADYGTFEGRGEVVKRWGKIYPLMKLCKIFDIEPNHHNVWDAICVLVESKGKTVCLQVDEMIGQRQIVYKQLNLKTIEPSAFEGISILDGRNMALILSVDGIIKQYRG
jgi:two-component system chemotaxis sensor kinase CheA